MKLTRFLSLLTRNLQSGPRTPASMRYYSAARRVILYCNDPDVTLKQVFTKEFLCGFEHYLLYVEGLCRNTSSFYFTVLRGIFRQAVEQGKLPAQSELFSFVFTGSDPTVKRAVQPDVIATICAADLSGYPRLKSCRDMFALSFHLHGISFVDLVYLTKADVHADRIVYRRHKTGGAVVVPINDEARRLLRQYASRYPGSPYALCLLEPNKAGKIIKYNSLLRRHNRQLDELSKLLGLNIKLTTYVSRHSWASIAYHNNVEVPAITESLGHRTEAITRVYLRSLSEGHLWKANQVVEDVISQAIHRLKIGHLQQVGCGSQEEEKEMASLNKTKIESRPIGEAGFIKKEERRIRMSPEMAPG